MDKLRVFKGMSHVKEGSLNGAVETLGMMFEKLKNLDTFVMSYDNLKLDKSMVESKYKE